jgi:hypothetical protein
VLAVQLGAWMLSSGEGDSLAACMHGDERKRNEKEMSGQVEWMWRR